MVIKKNFSLYIFNTKLYGVIGILSLLTISLGFLALASLNPPQKIIETHQILGIVTGTAILFFSIFRSFQQREDFERIFLFWCITGTIIFIGLIWTGHTGGEMVFEQGIGVQQIAPSKEPTPSADPDSSTSDKYLFY
ncbi:MAG: hypothetical protein Kow00108_00780 [Calditrichia bacterium]